MKALLRRADAHWRRRTDPAEVKRAIELYRLALGGEAGNWSETERRRRVAQTHVRLSRARFFLAENIYGSPSSGHSASVEKMKRLHDEGVRSAERALARLDPKLAGKLDRGALLSEQIDDADPAAVPALYWYATNLAKWGKLSGTATIMKHLDAIKAAMRFVCDRKPGYFYGGCHRYFGAYWVSLPLGKKPGRSRRHFESAIELAPDFLQNRVQMAKYYADYRGDRDLYVQLLEKVVDARPGVEAIAPENEIARSSASYLLQRVDRRF
ncbi:MAG: TRAP transporter TatT component family protein [Bradymonadaceae bacterium]